MNLTAYFFKKRILIYLTTAAVAIGVTAPFSFAESAPDVNISSSAPLVEKKSRFFDKFEVSSTDKISEYNKVFIRDPHVAFDKYWKTDHHLSVSRDYQAKITKRYAKVFKETLTKVFNNDKRFVIVNQKSPDALIITANIEDLNIYGPDDKPQIKHHVYHAGKGKLVANISNGKNQPLAKAVDLRETRDRGTLAPDRTDAMRNERDFKNLMKRWAKNLADHLANS